MPNEATAVEGLSAEETSAMHAVFGDAPAPAPAANLAPAEGAPDDGSVDVEIDAPAPAPANREQGNREQGKVVSFSRIRSRLEEQQNQARALVNEAARREQIIAEREQRLEIAHRQLKEREEIQAILDSGDPAEYFARTNKDPREFLERLARSGQPEAKQQSELQRLAKEQQELKAELQREREANKQARENLDRQRRERDDAVARQRADQNFVATISPEQHPHLTEEFSEREAVAFARQVLSEPVGTDEHGRPVSRVEAFRMRYGTYPDDATVAGYLESVVKERRESRAKSAWGRGTKRTTAADNPAIQPRPRPRAERTRSIETDGRSHPSKTTQEEIDRQSIAILEAAMKNKKE